MAAITATCASGNLLPLTNTPALTTIFTPPVFCSSRFHIGTSGAPTSYGWQDEVDPVWYSCMPPEWDAAACQSLTFSPALQCPHGWTMDKSKSVLGLNRGLITFATCCMRYAFFFSLPTTYLPTHYLLFSNHPLQSGNGT